ncbi:MAG TPA: NAD(P)-binding protein [Mycobacteriales bacterium]|nr:NAD(P)-binding protein [Mycobacteriales bacterium]
MTEKPFAITLDVATSLTNRTGAWRTERPFYIELMPPCNDACPAGQNIQRWLYDAESGDYEPSWRQIMADNPLPAVMGRICYHPCETACNRGRLDESVGIHSVERFLGDEAIKQGWTIPLEATPSGKRVLVVGSGPCGLSAAYHLRRLGHEVVLADAEADLGGMMRYGIPQYRLPRDVLDAEIARIVDLGVTVRTSCRIDDLDAAARAEGADAVLLAIGAQVGRHADIPAGDSARIIDALALLHQTNATDSPPQIGRRVVVYGGGNTAMDAARTAKRLGATDSVIVYRRDREHMPAHDEDLEAALAEGVQLRWLSTISAADEGRITVEKMRLDESGFPQPTGELEHLDADTVVLALGQQVDLGLLDNLEGVETDDGVVVVGPDQMTGHAGVFAGGDMTAGARTATTAVGHGKNAARRIDAWLRGTNYVHTPATPIATAERLNTWYYSDAPAAVQPQLEAARRASSFDEIAKGLDEGTALFEARRCLSCGNCFGCDNCYGVCPDNAVIKLGDGSYEFDLDHCKGCGLCAAECPCGAIEMGPDAS